MNSSLSPGEAKILVAMRHDRRMLHCIKVIDAPVMAAADDAFRDATRQLADAASRANRVALETAEGVFGVQLKAFGRDLAETTGYLGELARSPGPDGIRQLLPKGTQLLNDSLERWASARQEVMDLGLRSSKAWHAEVQAATPHDTAGATGNSH